MSKFTSRIQKRRVLDFKEQKRVRMVTLNATNERLKEDNETSRGTYIVIMKRDSGERSALGDRTPDGRVPLTDGCCRPVAPTMTTKGEKFVQFTNLSRLQTAAVQSTYHSFLFFKARSKGHPITILPFALGFGMRGRQNRTKDEFYFSKIINGSGLFHRLLWALGNGSRMVAQGPRMNRRPDSTCSVDLLRGGGADGGSWKEGSIGCRRSNAKCTKTADHQRSREDDFYGVATAALDRVTLGAF